MGSTPDSASSSTQEAQGVRDRHKDVLIRRLMANRFDSYSKRLPAHDTRVSSSEDELLLLSELTLCASSAFSSCFAPLAAILR